MKVVDLRNVFTNCNDELIEIDRNLVYYAEEKSEEGRDALFLLEYDHAAKQERIIANYMLVNRSFVSHYFSFPQEILVVMENGDSEVWILRVSKETGEEKSLTQLSLVGRLTDCMALDERHLLLYTEETERCQEQFAEYRDLTGFSRLASLYDLEEERFYYIRDARICKNSCEYLIPYEQDTERCLLILCQSGSEEAKEDAWRNRRWLGDDVDDSAWICPLFDLIVSIKAGEKKLPLEQILGCGTDGLIRYAGMDEKNLYFRLHHFPNHDQRICAYNKLLGTAAAVLKLEPDGGIFQIDPDGCRVYRISPGENEWQITGLLNSAVSGSCSNELGSFIACIEDRYLLARYELSDEKDSFEFHSLFDLKTGRQRSYECRAAVRGGTVVLY